MYASSRKSTSVYVEKQAAGEEAATYYRKSLRLNPGNSNAEPMIERIRHEKKRRDPRVEPGFSTGLPITGELVGADNR